MRHMERALALARRALGSASPNPPVGALVVKDGETVGEGWTQPPGRPHAEPTALRQAGDRSRGATLFVTLEPCNHFGRTPPCTEAIIDAGIAEVHASTIDPDPRVNGAGISRLREAGMRVDVGECGEQARRMMEAYLKLVETGRPFVTAKFAMSLDGKIATSTGESRWISGEESRRYAHELRATSSAVMVGVNTVLADDPQLTARDAEGTARGHQPLRVVVDGAGRTPADARLLSEPGRTVIAVSRADGATRRRLADRGAEIEPVPAHDGSVDLPRLLDALAGRGVTSILVEGGGALLGSLFDGGLIDKYVAFVAPTIIGGTSAPGPIGGDGVERIADALRLQRVTVEQLGRDVLVAGYP